MTSTLEAPAQGPTRPPPPPAAPDTTVKRSFPRRHRVLLIVGAALMVTLVAGTGTFVYLWNHTGPHELSPATAYQRFRAGGADPLGANGPARPAQGVYLYRGTGDEHISLPPKSQVEGPVIPGTVSYLADGCWTWRLDYSDSHWQNSTFCPFGNNVVEVGRAGWYRWSLVALSISDTATFKCSPEVVMPAVLSVGQRFPFTCTGTNSPIHMDPVTMTGVNRYIGPQLLRIGGTEMVALHFREVSTFTGGQHGTNVSDLWLSTVNGLPVKGSWETEVSSPTFLGTSTLNGHASFVVQSLHPHT
ncbi:MAG TPA: hypothetical protein VLZ77_09580 [Acidimicrobiales bacterium]|nr:hypothetical protein [Acidimicrobiales bacterium]